jgi:hypothetical protein
MHDCQSYREDWLAGTEEGQVDCGDCRSFCEDANAILIATVVGAPPLPDVSEEYWKEFENRLRKSLVRENAARTFHSYWKWAPVAAGAAIAAVVTWGSIRPAQPTATPVSAQQVAAPQIEIVDDHIQGLDPAVVTYLERSELFLRNYTKIEPANTEDLDDSRALAKQSLMEIAEQKKLAGNFAPVQITLDQYENVLREIKNLNSSQELNDVQTRIRSNGLIANMKAYQPQVILVSGRYGR